jgi:hypothetical protein
VTLGRIVTAGGGIFVKIKIEKTRNFTSSLQSKKWVKVKE